MPALCSMLTGVAQSFLPDDTALRLMCSHAHILCPRKKCEHTRSRSEPYWKRKYECTNRAEEGEGADVNWLHDIYFRSGAGSKALNIKHEILIWM